MSIFWVSAKNPTRTSRWDRLSPLCRANVQSVTVSHSISTTATQIQTERRKQRRQSHSSSALHRAKQQLRLMNSSSFGNWKIQAGASFDYSQYSNTTFRKIIPAAPAHTIIIRIWESGEPAFSARQLTPLPTTISQHRWDCAPMRAITPHR